MFLLPEQRSIGATLEPIFLAEIQFSVCRYAVRDRHPALNRPWSCLSGKRLHNRVVTKSKDIFT